MPQMDAVGLSENWLLRHCGDRHWNRMCESFGVASTQLCDAGGERLYAAFGALRARYSTPLASVRENDVLDTRIALHQFGEICFHSSVNLLAPAGTFSVELVSMFVARLKTHCNELQRSLPAPRLSSTAPRLAHPPALLAARRAVREGVATRHSVDGGLSAPGPPLGSAIYEPSPYVDFNGAGLLYFASYPTIADGLERRIVRDAKLVAGGDWATLTSTVARDVFFYANIEVGRVVRGELLQLRRAGGDVALHTRLYAADDGSRLADVFTVKRWLGACDTMPH